MGGTRPKTTKRPPGIARGPLRRDARVSVLKSEHLSLSARSVSIATLEVPTVY
jgi:hypothetical protein